MSERAPADAVDHGGLPPHRVRLPVMRQRWEAVTFLHWDYPVEPVQRLLPPALRVEPWNGRAWVGVVALQMRVRPPVGPTPDLSSFPETNVRTYVIGPDGRPGIWFFSLDAASAPAVVAGRLSLGLPYFLAAMTLERQERGRVSYRSRRSRPHAGGAGHDIRVATGAPVARAHTGPFDRYLTARFRLWTSHLGRTISVPVEHAPWPLRGARLLESDEDLVEAAGLPAAVGDPVVHYSDGVDVRIGAARLARA